MPEESVTINGITYRASDPVAQAYLANQEEPPKPADSYPTGEPPKSQDYVTIDGINYEVTDPVAQAYLAGGGGAVYTKGAGGSGLNVAISKPSDYGYSLTKTDPSGRQYWEKDGEQYYSERGGVIQPISAAETVKEPVRQEGLRIVTLDTGEDVTASDYYSENPTAQEILKTQGIDAYNSYMEDLVKSKNEYSTEGYIKATGGDIEYYKSLPEDDKTNYLAQLQATDNMAVEEFITNAGGNVNVYNALPDDKLKSTYLNYLQTIVMSNSALNLFGYAKDRGNEIVARNILAPYISTQQWQQIDPTTGEMINPSYDISSIPLDKLLRDADIVNAINTLYGDNTVQNTIYPSIKSFTDAQFDIMVS